MIQQMGQGQLVIGQAGISGMSGMPGMPGMPSAVGGQPGAASNGGLPQGIRMPQTMSMEALNSLPPQQKQMMMQMMSGGMQMGAMPRAPGQKEEEKK